MTLDKYGAGCRCLLHFRENMGKPYLDERSFIGARLAEFPDWARRPGFADNDRLVAISVELGLATSGRLVSDYDEMIRAHEGNGIVLLRPGEALKAQLALAPAEEPCALVTDINSAGLTAWLPTSDGRAETVALSRAAVLAGGIASALVLCSAA